MLSLLPITNLRPVKNPESFTATIYAIEKKRSDTLGNDDDGLGGKYIYVGSTSVNLKKRFSDHKSSARFHPEATRTRLHEYMIKEGFSHFEIVPLEILEQCVSHKQMHQMEQEWINFLHPIFNSHCASSEDNNNDININVERSWLHSFLEKCSCTCSKRAKTE